MKKTRNWAKGFFRLWIAYGIIFLSIFGGFIFWDFQYKNINNLKEEKYLYSIQTGELIKKVSGIRLLYEIDGKPYTRIYVGNDTLLFLRTVSNKVIKPIVAKHRQGLEAKLKDNLWESLFRKIKRGLMWIFTPLFIGLTIKWIFQGFKKPPIIESEEVET